MGFIIPSVSCAEKEIVNMRKQLKKVLPIIGTVVLMLSMSIMTHAVDRKSVV